jgi:hypothetical protein
MGNATGRPKDNTFYRFEAVRGALAGSTAGQSIRSCWLNGSSPDKPLKCSAFVGQTKPGEKAPKDATACPNVCTFDFRYCPGHLREIEHLTIAKSKLLEAMGIDGLGLFAGDPADFGKPKKGRTPIFRRGLSKSNAQRKKRFIREPDNITPYLGELLTPEEFDKVWDFKDDLGTLVTVTAPYALGTTPSDGTPPMVVDASCKRSAAAYINDARGAPGFDRNAELVSTTSKPRVRAFKNIYSGDEILVHYGKRTVGRVGYWESVGPSFIAFANVAIPPGGNVKALVAKAIKEAQTTKFTPPRDRRRKREGDEAAKKTKAAPAQKKRKKGSSSSSSSSAAAAADGDSSEDESSGRQPLPQRSISCSFVPSSSSSAGAPSFRARKKRVVKKTRKIRESGGVHRRSIRPQYRSSFCF